MASKPNGRVTEESAEPSAGAAIPEPEDIYRDDGGEGDGIPIIDPPTGEAAQREPEQPRKRGRGRPVGATSAKSSAKQAKAATDLTAILMSAHMMLAHIIKMEELELDEREAKQLSAAVNRVQELYDMPILTEKQLAWINLGFTGLSVYGTRYVAYTMRMKNERKKHPPTINVNDAKVM